MQSHIKESSRNSRLNVKGKKSFVCEHKKVKSYNEVYALKREKKDIRVS